MGVAIAGGVIAGIGLLSSMQGSAAASARRNSTGLNNWMQGELEKGVNNGREEYKAVFQEMQQAERNRALNLGAYKFEHEQSSRIIQDSNTRQKQMSLAGAALIANNVANQTGRGVVNSPTAKRQRMSNMMNLMTNLGQEEKNTARALKDTLTQAGNMRNQMTSDVYQPNIMGPSIRPEQESGGMLDMMGGIGGMLTGLGPAFPAIFGGE